MRSIFNYIALVAIALGVQAQEQPKVHDEGLRIDLFAEAPEIVTPIGMAIGPNNEIFVIESHTHLPPAGYVGPKGDRIRRFLDTNNDGVLESNVIVAEDLEAAMNLTVTQTGRLFVVGARAVWELIDENSDGLYETRNQIVTVKTANTYPHSCLLSITHSHDGWLYLGRGNNGSVAYDMVGSDATIVSGYGDGGNITRCRFDGSQLSEFATGFWNPFDLEFDQRGHLLAVDNDPDARGPNRMVDVVPHGDYGYQSLFGGGGNHPYQGWDGSLPGTLPYISGTGEAPSGLLDARRAALPTDYDQSILVTVWNEHTIENHRVRPQGASLKAEASLFVSGPQDFRPVAIDTDHRGNVFITDWVRVDYPNHGAGRIWRIAPVEKGSGSRPERYQAGATPPPDAARLTALRTAPGNEAADALAKALQSPDPFVRQAAVTGLAQPHLNDLRKQFSSDPDANVRLGALLALRTTDAFTSDTLLTTFLRDPSLSVRQAALRWIGECGLARFRSKLFQTLTIEPTSPTLFETYLATIEVLTPEFITQHRDQTQGKANRLPRQRDLESIVEAIDSQELPASLRAIALTHYPHHDEANAADYLLKWVETGPPELQREAIRSLGELGNDSVGQRLLEIALDSSASDDLRAESLLALEKQPLQNLEPILQLSRTTQGSLLQAVLRFLALHISEPAVKSALNRTYVIHRNRPKSTAIVEQLEDTLYPDPGCCQARVTYRPQSTEEWQLALRKGGDPVAGRRVFYSVRSGCVQCHTINQRGGTLGPNLSNAGQSVDREQLILSILQPSLQFPPQYQAWTVETKDGEEHRGLQLDHKANGAIELFTLSGITERFAGDDIAHYGAEQKSLMPDGLEAGLSTSEMRDLVAFLESLK